MKKYILILLISFQFQQVFAQFLSEFAGNEMKYWKLRGRLIGDDYNKDVYNGFLTVGAGKGMSVPAAQKNPTHNRHFGKYNINNIDAECNQQKINGILTYAQYDINGNITGGLPLLDPRDGKELKGMLQYSDNSLVLIGNYIAVLATEWALLKRENSSTYNTERELYYALLAVDRLDLAGESMYPGTANSPDLNGFLMRNDVDEMQQLNTTGKNIDLIISSKACVDESSGCSESNATVKNRNAMSQDEVIGLLLGFGLMRKMLPFSANYNGIGLRQWSIDITNRIVGYVKKSGTTNLWAIVDPDKKKRVCRGSKVWRNSYAMAKAADYITNGLTFQNNWSTSLGAAAWYFQKNFYATNTTDIYLGFVMPQIMQTELNYNQYEYILIPGNYGIGHDGAYNVSMFQKLLTISKSGARPNAPFFDFTGKYTNNLISQTYSKQIYELLGSVISGYFPILNETYWRNEFNKLNCGCNCMQGNNPVSWYGCQYYENNPNPPATTMPANPWGVEDRWAFNRYYGGCDAYTFNEYNGLDYMLAYNLYRYKYFAGGYNSRIRTYSSNKTFPYLSQPNPYDNNNTYLIGSPTYPFEAKAVFSISAFYNTVLNSNASVKFTAGSNIKLLPGFKALPGSIFSARIEEYDCTPDIISTPNSSYVSWKNGEDSLVNSDFDYSIDSTIDIQLEDDSLNDVNEPEIDTNLYVLVYTNNLDTFIYDLNPDYIYSDDGQIIYAPQNGQNKAALQQSTFDKLTLYPNPANDLAYLEYILYYDSDIRVRVYNQLGQYFSGIIQQEWYTQTKGKHKLILNTASLAPGMYYCEFSIDGKREVKKFIVIK